MYDSDNQGCVHLLAADGQRWLMIFSKLVNVNH